MKLSSEAGRAFKSTNNAMAFMGPALGLRRSFKPAGFSAAAPAARAGLTRSGGPV